MSGLRTDHAGVASPLPSRAKRRLNEKLIKIKEEMLLEKPSRRMLGHGTEL